MAARFTAFAVIAIVAVTFVAGLIVGAQREDDSGPVDLIVYNARVYTGNPDAKFAEAIAIRGNRIWRVGSNREIKRLMRRATTVIDAHGGTVTAGFRDGSVDLKAGGLTLAPAAALPIGGTGLPIGGATTSNPAPGTATSSTASASTSGSGSAPGSNALADRASGSATASGTAAAGAGAAGTAVATAPNAMGATASGLAASASGATATGLALAPETGDTLDAIQQAIGHANTVGITSVGVTARTPDDLLPYDTLLRTRELTARVNAALAAEWPLDEAAVARLDVLRKRYEGVPLFKLKAVRLMVTDEVPSVGAATTKAGKKLTKIAKSAGAAAGAAAAQDEVPPPSPPGSPAMVEAMERAAALAINTPAATPAAAERVAALGRTIALLEEHDWQVILETKDAGDAGLALSAIEASRPAAAAGATATTSNAASSGSAAATSATSTAKAKRHVRLEVSASTLLDKDTVARLIALDVIASTPKPIASTRVGASLAATAPGAAAAAGETPAASAADNASAWPTPAPLTHADGNGDVTTPSPEEAALFDAMTRPYANLIASTAPFVLYSAWPVTPLDPRFALSLIAQDGVRLAGKEKPNHDTLTARLARAIDACTRYAAFASGDQEQQGTIAKEMLADLVIFSADLFALPPDKFMDAEVTTTIFDGKVIYTRPEPTSETSSQ
jgi:predicted amidohydrolase YtcJ